VTLGDPASIAERLRLPEEAVRRVQRRGFLRELDLDEAEIRERLWRGHLAFVLHPATEPKTPAAALRVCTRAGSSSSLRTTHVCRPSCCRRVRPK
jgi:hypothetical protein